MTVLVVDDEEANRKLLRAQLEAEGHRVLGAAHGFEALAVLERERVDAIISDILMPQMDGYRLCYEVRNSQRLQAIPFIFYTATYTSLSDEKLCHDLGADKYLRKPAPAEAIFTALREVTNIAAVRHTPNRSEPLSESDVMKEYSERLVFKLKEKNMELTHASEKAQAQLRRLELLSRITHAIGERQELSSIFQVVVCSLEDNFPVDFGCVCLYEPVEKTFTVTSVGMRSRTLALELALTEGALIPIDQNGLSLCVQGQLVYVPDIGEIPHSFARRLAARGLRSLVAAPLLDEKKVFGVLITARRQAESFSSGDCEFLRQLSEHVGLAAHQAQLYSALQQAYDDLRQSQQTVMQQERLRALGQMASGVAHDINNAISPVALYTESLLEQEPGLSDRTRSYLTTIRRAIEDVADTVSRMRQFYRAQEPERTLSRVNLNRIVEQVVELTRARWHDLPQEHGVVISFCMELMPGLPDVMGAESEIRDAFTNLIFNAVDAMPTGGTLTIRTLVVTGTQGDGHDTGKVVKVEVQDTGVGMDEETRRRCLEPFFTTKGERGTGLGLAMVYGMVQRHNAEIVIDSAPGKGTTLRLSFSVAVTTLESTNRPAMAMRPEQSLRILIVDDDPLIIESLRSTLESDGHRVTAANGGQAGAEAFLAAESRDERFAVVITDLGMPHIDGRKVAAAVKTASPTTPVIMLTGWGQQLMADSDAPAHVDRVLNKPPKLIDLRRALAELVASPASALGL